MCIIGPDRRVLTSLGVLTALVVFGAHPGRAQADVLYNQRAIALGGAWNAGHSAEIGGQGFFGMAFDLQAADDFLLAAPSIVTRVTMDFGTALTAHPNAAPAGGFLVEIFPDVSGVPAAAPAYSVTTSSFQRLGTFPAGTNGDFNISPDHRHTWAIDLPGGGALLDAGTWWLAVQGVDLTTFADYYFVAARVYDSSTIGLLQGSSVHLRDGSVAHGNPHGGGYGPGAINWFTEAEPSDLSFSVEGTVVPGAGSWAVLALAVIGGAARRRRAATAP